MSMEQELLSRTQFFEKELGPCLLLVKCYELLGDRDETARSVARQVTLGEMTRLSQMNQRGFALNEISDQFLRAIYALQMAGPPQQALAIFRTFITAARTSAVQGRVRDITAFRIAAAAILVDDHGSVLTDMLPAGSFAHRLASAWRVQDGGALDDCCEELENAIESAENEGLSTPWQDDWHYVVLRRLRLKVHSLQGDRTS